MVVLPAGKTLAPGDLSLMVRDSSNAPVTPTSLNYTIFAKDADGNTSLISQPRLQPVMQELGLYYVSMTLPTSWADGDYQLVWYLQQTPGEAEVQILEDFSILAVKPGTGSLEAPSVLMAKKLQVTEKVADLVMSVRELLSDTNPDRNYHFRPPTAAKTVAGYTTRVGYIWTDQTILRFLKLAIAQINTANPKNLYSYKVETIPDDNWGQAAALGAAAKCLTAEAARWIADEFGYSLNGVSLDLEKSAKYQGLGEQYNSEFKEWMVPLTANRPASVGLRQMKFLR